MNRSPATTRPSASLTDSMKPSSPLCWTCTTLPSIRFTPSASAMRRRNNGIEPGIEMIGIGHVRQRQPVVGPGFSEASRPAGHDVHVEHIGRHGPTLRAVAQPEMVEVDAVHLHAEMAEGMDVRVPRPGPVHELDAELDAGLRGAHEFVLVDLHGPVEVADRRNRGLAHAHGADLIGLDELDVIGHTLRHPRERGRGHPAGGAAADDHDFSNFALHLSSSPDTRFR